MNERGECASLVPPTADALGGLILPFTEQARCRRGGRCV